MLYRISSKDVNNSLPIRQANRPAHLARLEQLQEAGRLVLAGPYPAIDSPAPAEAGFSGSLIVAEFKDLQQATDWANNDPYKLAGVYDQVDVRPFLQVFPK